MSKYFYLFLTLIISSTIIIAQNVVNIPVTTNGKILTIANSNGTNFIGGNFSQVSPITGTAVLLGKTTTNQTISFPKVNGTVYAVESDGEGGFYIGGNFTKVGNFTRLNIAHIDKDGLVSNFAPTVESDNLPIVYSIKKDGNFIYFAGSFRYVNSQSRNFIAKVDIDGNLTPWDANANDEIYTIEVLNGKIYFGGNFSTIGTTARFKIACLDSDGNIDNWYPLFNNQIKQIKFHNNKFYISGGFTNVNNVARQRFAVVDIDGNLDNFALNFNQRVEDFAILNDKIYFGGRFTKVNNISKNYIAISDLNGNLINQPATVDNFVYSVSSDVNTVYFGGAFNKFNGIERNYIAKINEDGTLTEWNPNPNNIVFAIMPINQSILVGGAFMGVGGVKRSNFAAINETGDLEDLNIDVNGEILSIYRDENTIYIGGNFTSINKKERRFLAAIDIDGNLLDWNPNLNSAVYTIEKFNNELFIGGTFSKVGTQTRNYVASFDNMGVLSNWNPIFNGPVFSIQNTSNQFYVGGFFSKVNSLNRSNICSFNHDKTLNNWAPYINDAVLTMCSYENTLYVGGWFSSIDDNFRARLASFDNTGSLTEWTPNANNSVWTIFAGTNTNGIIYVGGDFTSLNNNNILHIGAFDASGNLQNWSPNPNKSVYAIQAGNEAIFSGGIFTNFGNLLSPNLASLKFDYEPPQIPSLLYPANLQQGLELNLTFDWTTALYAGKYQLQVSETPQFITNIIDVDNIPQSQFSVESNQLNYESTYFWRVRSSNGSEYSDWTPVWTFGTIIGPPLPPLPLLPENNKIDEFLSPLMDWDDANNAESYELQISKNADFSTFEINKQNILSSEYQITINLQNSTQFYWRVRAKNISGYSDWSAIFTFTTAEFIPFSVNLKKGWNWSSINITPLADSVSTIMKEVVSNLVIMKNLNGQTYLPPNINQIKNWNYREGYQIYMANADTITVLGLPINPITTPIYLKKGWNLISYLRTTPMNIATALASIVEKGKLVIAKNVEGKIFLPPTTNTIGNIIPGSAYQLYLSEADTLFYPANGAGKVASIDVQDYDTRNFVNKLPTTNSTMNIILNNIDLPNNSEILAYSSDNKLVGASRVINNSSVLTIWGNDEQNIDKNGITENDGITLKVFNTQNSELKPLIFNNVSNIIEHNQTNLAFKKDAVVEIEFVENDKSINISPNPANSNISINFNIGKEEINKIFIADLSGKVLKLLETTDLNSDNINISELSNGTYNLIIHTNKKIYTEKIVITR